MSIIKMFILILTIGIITAVAQIIASFDELKVPSRKGIGGITTAGWTFYVCTIVLAVLPAIQKVWQDSIDEQKDYEGSIAQAARDRQLKQSYDSSLLVMKGKFDTTTSIVSNTLGKYGFKLDSARRELVNLRDSVKPHSLENPVLKLTPDTYECPGISFVRRTPEEGYVFKICVVSLDGGSAFFDVMLDYAVGREVSQGNWVHYQTNWRSQVLLNSQKLSNEEINFSYIQLDEKREVDIVYVWLHGNYKRVDGSGLFGVDVLYAYYMSTKAVRTVVGETRSTVLGLIKGKRKIR